MRMYDLIQKKKEGGAFTGEELSFIVEGFTKGSIPDYQMAALCMAIYFRGMTDKETAALTDRMAGSGDRVDLSAIPGVKVDKHSTGGVGDKTTLVVAPIAAACGLKVAKMSGRGLGHTGGTVDKLESIPGFRTTLEHREFIDAVNRAGLAVIGQSGNLAPADKKLYALRDVTATVDSIPLIASSIMSKKIAAGADVIQLDVKTGSGAFMKCLEDAITLAEAMVRIGTHVGRSTAALITDMDLPLGRAVGNALEVAEAVATLRGEGPEDLTQISLELAAGLLMLAGRGEHAPCLELARKALDDGSALARLRAMVEGQGGDLSVIDHPSRLPAAPVQEEIKAPRSGYVTRMDTQAVGVASVMLGAGRETKDSPVDLAAGIMILKKTGDWVEAGEPLARFYTADRARLKPAEGHYLSALTLGEAAPAPVPLVLARVTAQGVTRFS